MSDLHANEREALPRAGLAAYSGPQPSSSRMLATYLADVEQFLDEQRWDLALRDAYDLPQIAVALTDPGLTCSSDRCKAWCEEWIRPQRAAGDSGADPERICHVLDEHAQTSMNGDSVPLNALRRLRLRRYARNAPRAFNSELVDSENPGAAEAVDLCTAVVDGVRRWYAHSACRNPTTQANLARLAVLR
ncbi:MAG TPA: hypothetical protein VLX90_09275 [Steroidobacteraceae bacterium]|nr:hypothetical protein [Steroidobacteraceae bacterium]